MTSAISLTKSSLGRLGGATLMATRSMATATYEMINVAKTGEKENVGLITLNRPKALNALCEQLVQEVGTAVAEFDRDQSVGAMVVTGGERAFAAGADIKEMSTKEFKDVVNSDFLSGASAITNARKPIIAAVNGFALGGGCELAMSCDMIIAGDNAKFGQPEIKLGTIPGLGGTQRLIRSVGKSLAMYLCLTGEMIDASTALQAGLVAKVFPKEKTIGEAVKIAETIASYSQVTTALCKEAVNTAYESSLAEGLHVERRLFNATFATHDRKEGMDAFTAKRPPNFKNE